MCSTRRRAGSLVRASASGLLSAFGHNPTIAIRSFKGEARFDPEAPEQASLQFEIDAGSLAVTGDVNEKDRHEMERAMREEVLETARYPEIRFESSIVQAARITEGMFRMKIDGSPDAARRHARPGDSVQRHRRGRQPARQRRVLHPPDRLRHPARSPWPAAHSNSKTN